jgi:hypothetical protein
LLSAGAAKAASLENGSFELPVITRNFVQIDESQVPGWSTTASDRLIEIWKSGYLGVPAYDGNQFAELNATQPSTLFQQVVGIPGNSIVGFSWAHRGRAGIDTAEATVLDVGRDGQAGTADDKVLFRQTAVDGTSAWGVYKGSFVALGNTIQLDFAAIDAQGGRSVGNFLDGITLMAVANLDTIANGTARILADESDLIRDSLDYDCRVFDKNNVCIRFGARITSETGSDYASAAGVLIAAYRPFTNARIGAFIESPGPTRWPSGFSYGAEVPTIGAFAGYGVDDGSGLQLRASAALRRGSLTYVRELNLASGSGDVVSWGAGAEVGYGFGLGGSGLIATPFAGLQQVSSVRRLYTEDNASAVTEIFTYGRFGSPVTTGRLGVKLQAAFGPSVTASLAGGFEHDFNEAERMLSVVTPTLALDYDAPERARRNRAFGAVSAAYIPAPGGEIRLTLAGRQASSGQGTEFTALLTVAKGF